MFHGIVHTAAGRAGVVTLCALSLTLATPVGSRAQEDAAAYTLDDWMSVTEVKWFTWSPDGAHFYYTSNAGRSGTEEIFQIPSAGGEPRQLSTNPPGVRPEPKRNVVLSADGETLFYTVSRYFAEYDDILRMPAEGGAATPLTFNGAVIQTSPAPHPGGDTLAFFARLSRGTEIFLLDLRDSTTWPVLFEPGPESEHSPVWSPDGEQLAFQRDGDIWIRTRTGGEARRLVEDAYAGNNSSPVWSPDGSRIAFLTGKSGYTQIGIADVETGRVTPLTYEPRYHEDPSWSPDGQWLTFTRSDSSGLSNQVAAARATGGGPVRILTQGAGMRRMPQFSPDGARIAYLETTDTRTSDIWTIPSGGGTPQQITHSMGAIDPADLSEAEVITYTGAGDLPITALLYKPKNFDPERRYPVVVRLHGHPGQWNHSMQMMWQYFIQKGFILIAPNPRGSRGFGQGFHDLHIADYGGAEFQDVMNVLTFLEDLPYVDTTRKATWGGSGGGYMSFVIATKAPEAFQAQVIRAPVSSWRLLAIDRYGASGRAWKATRTPVRERSEFGGSYAEIPQEYIERSPINFVERVQVPQLLMQGLRDSSVPPRQSQVWVDQMRELGKEDLINYVEYPREDHSLTRYRDTVRDRLVRMERFLAEHLRLTELAY